MAKSYREGLKKAGENDPVVADLREAARLITRAHRFVCKAAYNEHQTCNAIETGGLLERLKIAGELIGAMLRRGA